MVILKHKNGTITNIKINKDVLSELIHSSKIDKEIDEVYISRIVYANTEKHIAKLKDVCTQLKVFVVPLNRRFTKHRIYIREDNLKEAFKKLLIIKGEFGDKKCLQ